jgi:predicted RNase H-like HicB family nuclease
MSEKRRYAIAVVREGAEYWAFVPDVPGVYGRGATSDEAMADATDALEDYLTWLREKGEAAPEPAADAVEVRYADVPA